jgi:hypothetical protein
MFLVGKKENLVSISCLEEKGDRVAFVDGKVILWSKESNIEDVRVIGTREGSLYKIVG